MKHLFVAILAGTLVLVSCSRQQPAPTAQAAHAAKDNPAFAQLVDDYFDEGFRYSPEWATYVGIHLYDHELGDRTQAAIQAHEQALHGFLDRLTALDKASLSFDQQIDAQALEGQIRSELLDEETLRLWETNPMSYAGRPAGAIDGLVKRDFAPPAERLASVTARLLKVPAIYDAARANLKTPPKVYTELAIRMTKGAAGYLETTLPAWAKQAAAGDDAALTAFTEADRTAVAATHAFAGWLEKGLLPVSNGNFAIGAANYSRKLEYDEMVDMPLAEVLAIGERQLEKDHAEFVATARKLDPSKSADDVWQALAADHPSAENLIPFVQQSLEQARQFVVEHHIVSIPSDVRPTVAPTPPFARDGSLASMSTPGPYETKATEAFYYVTPVEPDWDAKHTEEYLRAFNTYVTALTDIHEVWPGHYVQFLYAPQFPTKVRKLLGAGTNSEGWAHYAEQMMVDEGFGGGDPRYRLAQREEALLRDCRYVVGIKLHTESWSIEKAAKLFVDRCFQQPPVAQMEAERGTYDPTYLYYTLGKIEVQKLRDDYMKQTGATLEQFNDAFVSQGTLPIPLVRKLLLGKR